MAPLIGAALIGGGASLLGGLMGRSGAKDQNAANIQMAREAQAFEHWQSSTAHGREVADLRGAGLNPILSATGGAGASTAKGVMAQQVNEMQPLENAMNAGGANARTALEMRNIRETNDNIRMDTDLKQSSKNLNSINYNVSQKNESILIENLRQARAEADMAEADAVGRKTEGEIDKSTWGRVMRYINRANPLGATGSSAIRALRPR